MAADLAQSVRELDAADDVELPAALSDVLGRLARQLGADRVALAAGAGRDGHRSLRWEYVAPGFAPSVPPPDATQSSSVPVDSARAPRVPELHLSLDHARARCESTSARSAITVPIGDDADPIAQLEVQALQPERAWDPELADEVAELASALLPTVRRLMSPERNGQDRSFVYHAAEEDHGRALELAERRYAAIAEDSDQLIGRLSPDLRLIDANGPACAYAGLPREGLVELPLSGVVHPDDYDGLRAALRALTPAEPRAALDLRIYSPRDGGYRRHRFTCRALFDRDGKLVEYQGIGTDVENPQHVGPDAARAVGLRREPEEQIRLIETLLGLMEKAHDVTAEEVLARLHGPDNPLPVLVLRLVRSVLSGTWDEEAEAGILGLAQARRTVDRFLGGRDRATSRSDRGVETTGGELIDLESRRERQRNG